MTISSKSTLKMLHTYISWTLHNGQYETQLSCEVVIQLKTGVLQFGQ
jgi:hypothetical protein